MNGRLRQIRIMQRIAAFTFLALSGVATACAADRGAVRLDGAVPYTAFIPASPSSGFNYPYFLRLPSVPSAGTPLRLIVETNNTGVASDDSDLHLKAARRATESGVGAFAANRLELPLLVPVFPRPASDGGNLYTHALDTDSMDIQSGPMKRLDLQLIAMIDDAIRRLGANGMRVDERVLMAGFSASATFANRFSMIHPRRVAAVAMGGFNSILMLPVEKIDGTELPYPLGISDFTKRFGHPFERERWLAIPQFAFMGENDTNDAVQYDDAYPGEERRKVYETMGKAMPARWAFIQEAYRDAGAHLKPKTYPGIGHGTNGPINNDIADFLATPQ